MALDTATVRHLDLVPDAEPAEALAPVAPPSVDTGSDIGEALRAVRTFRGLTFGAVAEATRIRQSYIEALEDLRLEDLPSRPFTIGYIRAYAALLGLDAEAAVQRFKADAPDDGGELRAPVGVRPERDPRLALILAGGLLVVGAIVLWNVAQRAMAKNERPAQVATSGPATPRSVSGANGSAVALGAPLPAPVESTTPEPYKTPGLDAAAANGGSADAATAASKARAAAESAAGPDAAQLAAIGSPFKPNGVIHGAAPADASGVILQARKGASLVVRGGDGSVFFARQLSAGEAYRAPRTGGLIADVSDPSVFNVYWNGALTGRLISAQTSLSKLIKPSTPPAPAPAQP